MKVSAARVLTQNGWLENHTVDIIDGKIAGLAPVDGSCDTEVYDGMLLPGFIDTQVNGGGGVLLNQTPTAQGIDVMAKAHLQFGTTGMLPTLITDDAETMARAADAIAQTIEQQHKSVLGVHFEGPFLSKAKKGVHSEGYIRVPTDTELATLSRKDLGKVLVTVAPETVAPSLIQELVKEGVLVALGHSNANAAEVEKALEAGANCFTHLYNAMSPLTSREPGMVGTALSTANTFCGLIVDHHHVHPKSARFAIDCKSAERIMLVTDAMAHVGAALTRLAFFDTEIVRDGDKLTTPAGTLAGSCLDMLGAVRNTHKDLHVPFAEAVRMASLTPAEFLGLSATTGSISVGKRADLVLVSDDLQITSIWHGGNQVESATHSEAIK